MNGLRDLGDQLKDKIGEGVMVIASVDDGKCGGAQQPMQR